MKPERAPRGRAATLPKEVSMKNKLHPLLAAALIAVAGAAGAQTMNNASSNTNGTDRNEVQHDQMLLNQSAQVVGRMKAENGMTQLLGRAKGVFIMPHYGRGAIGVGFQGGEGVLVMRQGNGFGNPVFYNMGGVSIGAQAGGVGGPVALFLMTDKAVQDFTSGKNFSVNADAGLTIVSYSRRAEASGGKVQDIVFWSGTHGAYAGASVGLTDVTFDDNANKAWYGRDGLNAAQIVHGQVQNPHNKVLDRVLAI
jgi:lipid-binding SYLF domain-containing protein